MTLAQRGLCAYCCSEISGKAEDTHNEHIAPESEFPAKSLDYDNLVASCNRRMSCGTFKRDDFDSGRFVSPLQPDCDAHFRYLVDGRLVGVDGKGSYTIDLLNLNDYELQTARRSLMPSVLPWADAATIQEHYLSYPDGRLKQFADMLEQFCNDGTF